MQKSTDPARPRKRLYVGIGVAASAILLAVVGLAVASTPLMCGSCHTVAPSHEGWQNAAHRDVWCIECHAAPGPVGRALTLMSAAGDVLAYVTHKPEHFEIAANVPQERCVACHEDAWANPAFSVWHAPPDSRCDVCHRTSYHQNERIVYPEIGPAAREVAYGDLVTCAECHVNRQMLRADIMAEPRIEAATSIKGSGEG